MAAWCRRAAARRIGATATTRSTSPPAERRCRPRAVRSIPRSSSHLPRRPVHEPGGRVADRGCCSCARGTAPGPRSPRRCSSTCQPGRSTPRARAAIRSRCIPNAVRVLRKRGIDISANRTKHLDEFVAQRFDTVITLCDRVREVCPEFPSRPRARALEHSRPGARGSDQPWLVSRRSSAPRPSSRRASASGSTCSPDQPTTRRTSTHAER